MTGQDAINSSSTFSQSCNITGCIITKMDSDSGGGVALSIKDVTGLPIKFITYGEKITAVFKHNNILGIQFHPEKSQKYGLSNLKNFYEQSI